MNWFHRPPLRSRWLWAIAVVIVVCTFLDGGGLW